MGNEKKISGFDEGMRIVDGVPSSIDCLAVNIKKVDRLKEGGRGPHYHNYIEILYGMEGEVESYIFDDVITFGKGDLLVINPREPHTFYAVSDNAKYIVAKFMPEVLYSKDSSASAMKYALAFMLNTDKKRVFTKSEIGDIKPLMEEIIDEWYEKKYGYDLIVKADIVKIFSSVLRYFKAQESEDTEVSYEVYGAIEKALDYVAREYPTADAKTAADVCNLSYSYFSRNFKKVVKRNFCEYVNYIRLIEAEKMMFTTDKTITEIAADTGFSTTSHFIKRFKEYKNISPKQFRMNIGR